MEESKNIRSPVRVLLGGGIGSGKSRAGERFTELGAEVVEADRLGHEVLESDGEVFVAVSHRWPEAVVDGRLDRTVLASFVFVDPAQLKELEAMTHPAIVERIVAAALQPNDLVVEIPIVMDVPGAWTRVFVDAGEGLRVQRSVSRGSSAEDVRRRMANQASRATWLSWADRLIENNGSIDDLERQVDALWRSLRSSQRRSNS